MPLTIGGKRGNARALVHILLLAAAFIAWPTSGTRAQRPNKAEIADVVVSPASEGVPISRNIYGQFSEHLGHGVYGGLWVGPDSSIPNTRGFRNDVVSALRALEVPLLRWPGGCFADKYDWRDGIGPRKRRPNRVNTAWGDVPETNAVGTHEFMDLLDQLGGTSAYIAGNIGSLTPTDMARWMEYMTAVGGSTLAKERGKNGSRVPFRVAFFGVGNESWGCGGNMTAEKAAATTRRYAAFFATAPGTRTIRVAAGPNVDDYHFTEVMMRDAGARYFDALSLHHYTFAGTWERKGSAIGFSEAEWGSALRNARRMEELVTRHSAIMDRYDQEQRVMLAVDEWGSWLDTPPGKDPNLYSWQNTLRDALVAAITLNVFHRHSDRVRMATIAQMVNVDQAMIHTDGPRMFRTPTYWVFDLYKPFRGATPLASVTGGPRYRVGAITLPAVDASVARAEDGIIWISLVNLDPTRARNVRLTIPGMSSPCALVGHILTAEAMDQHNDFDEPDRLVPARFSATLTTGGIVSLPAKSIVVGRLSLSGS
ncbi:alpha-N-arabinofuranosidase [Sphingomonas sp. RRHST34]|uniref:non-reducing end alpha-L-arabinofuranosidase n=1 Tax=Sphingomonas citri TaxID=2862499 RepID=A0ABS7BSC9_9SPHN|nr:alpha-L-arabinofuranosidase C-terminal domain-containing protein [Sphingomonas citri]MBW6532509.1 alpha-N-arabinofuranosidase [Sphingomonas citri]